MVIKLIVSRRPGGQEPARGQLLVLLALGFVVLRAAASVAFRRHTFCGPANVTVAWRSLKLDTLPRLASRHWPSMSAITRFCCARSHRIATSSHASLEFTTRTGYRPLAASLVSTHVSGGRDRPAHRARGRAHS